MKSFLLTLLIASLTAFAVARASLHEGNTHRETTFERIQRTGEIRCGYVPYPPEIMVDPATKKLSGWAYDMVEAIGKQAGLKIVWSEEVGIANMFDGLYTNRYDALCVGVFENPARARRVIFSNPVNYTASYIYARADDTRFTDDFSNIDRPGITVAVVEGEISEFIAREKFPHAHIFALPQTASDPTQAMLAVATGKADIALSQKATALAYMDQNKGQIRQVSEKPIQAFSQTLASFHPDNYALKLLFDTAIRALYADGTIPAIFEKYDPAQQTYMMLSKPYQ